MKDNLNPSIGKILYLQEQLVNSLITELRQKDFNSLRIKNTTTQRYPEKYLRNIHYKSI